MRSVDQSEVQRERALQAWTLMVHDSPEPEVIKALRKVLRIKRFDLPKLRASLPGPVRRGARFDLEPLVVALTDAGVHCELQKSAKPG